MGDAEVAMQMLLYIEKETQPYPRYTYIVFVESIDVIFKLAIEVPRFKRLPIDKHGLHKGIIQCNAITTSIHLHSSQVK